MSEEQLQEEVKESEVETPEAQTPEVKEEVVEAAAEPTIAEKIEEIAAESKEVVEDKPAEPEVPAYSPNYKFKVMDKEHEFDEFLRDVVTNEEREKQLREIYEKAYGLDVVKPKYQETREKYKELETKYGELDSGISNLDQMVKRGDLDGFFDSIKIPKETVYQWVANKVQYQQATPEEKQRIDSQQGAQRDAWSSSDQAQSYQQQLETQKVDFLQREMDLVMTQPDVQTFSAAYDAKAGKPGAFFEYAKERGETAFVTKGTNYTAKQAVDEAMGMLKPFIGLPVSQPTPQPTAIGQPAPPQQTQKPRVIPNVQGRGNSPVGSPKVKSIEEIRTRYREMAGE
jgi:hypothetical protein